MIINKWAVEMPFEGGKKFVCEGGGVGVGDGFSWLVRIDPIFGSPQCPEKAWHASPTGLSFIRKDHVI